MPDSDGDCPTKLSNPADEVHVNGTVSSNGTGRSRFGRLRKPNQVSDMEFTPLVRVRPPHSLNKVRKTKAKPLAAAPCYLVGDLLWSKVGGHPFWPCMVSFDPLSGIYTKTVRQQHRLYHVQYFGDDAQHGWTQPGRIMPYEGLAKFLAMGNLERAPYNVPDRKRDAWRVAVQEATDALELTRSERKHKLTFEYYDPRSKGAKSKTSEVGLLQENSAVEKPPTKEEVCTVCEKMGATLFCTGPCKLAFHADCLGVSHVPRAFVCDECTTGKHLCLVCKDLGETEKCSLESCGCFYHKKCLTKLPLPLKQDPFVCPRHFCLGCFQEKPTTLNAKGRLLRCVRCPSAFHVGCLAAGSYRLGPTAVVCPQHGAELGPSINVNWCFVCSTGGHLLCCEGCPAAFHQSCLGLKAAPKGPFLCSDCRALKHPKYGHIIWVKLGCYRWWPAQVCSPAEVPVNIAELKHRPVGEFAVRFYGSHDYYWTNRGHVFLFEEGDRGSLTSSSKSLARLFEMALEEATEAWEQQRRARDQSAKPAPFRMIRANRPVGQVAVPALDLRTVSVCACTAQDPCRADCLNRLLLYECRPDLCPAGEHCKNQHFLRREYAQVTVIRAEGRGWGLRTDQALTAGDFVMEYVGEIINEQECERRLSRLHLEHSSNFYFLTLDRDRIIDAGPRGNLSRFMNHSCDPNCETQKWTVNGDTRVGIFAIRDIAPGTELTFNYNLDCRGNERIKCACGASNCSGYMGLPAPRPTEGERKAKRRK
ncbi:hypothetical protein HPB47_024549 [Ixodes persulcatus]|uniref:Uncharacterized protein n=1 Tax=Ixodes persulcatus TaxID=34615 RepID=A0AC60Q4E3_IXOPE|nr:hypothetical protein HPB47_024549 [Ixodes persulcatus]